MECPVCHADNDEFAVTCVKCRGFLQNRVPNLDLFSTLWRVLERPRSAFQQITLAEHKNYSFLLFAFFGIGVMFAGLSIFRVGDRFNTLFEVIFWALVLGLPLGVLLCPLVAVLHWVLARVAGGRGSFRISMGISAYALTPIIGSVLFLLPIELLTFGIYLFTYNPPPMTLKPELYLTLIGLDVAMALWTIGLLSLGTVVGYRLGRLRSLAVSVVVGAVVVGGVMLAGHSVVRAL